MINRISIHSLALLLLAGVVAPIQSLAAQEECGEIYCHGCDGYTYGHCFVEGEPENQPFESFETAPDLLAFHATGGPSVVSFASSAGLGLLSSGGGGFHGDCRVCQVSGGGAMVPAENCHPICDGGESGTEAFATPAYQAVMESARSGDIRGILAASETIPGTVQINHSRRSLQVLNCQKTIVANLPLEDMYSEAVRTLAVARTVKKVEGSVPR